MRSPWVIIHCTYTFLAFFVFLQAKNAITEEVEGFMKRFAIFF